MSVLSTVYLPYNSMSVLGCILKKVVAIFVHALLCLFVIQGSVRAAPPSCIIVDHTVYVLINRMYVIAYIITTVGAILYTCICLVGL